MSLREKFGFGRQQFQDTDRIQEDIERKELAHKALFSEIVELRDVCKFLLNGHKNHVIYLDSAPVYNITCISGETTRIKVTQSNIIDDYSVSSSNISRVTTEYTDDRLHANTKSFDITSAYMNGFTEDEMVEQLKALYDLQEAMLIADGYILPAIEADEDHYAA